VPSANHRNQQYAKIGEYAFSNDVVTDWSLQEDLGELIQSR
jgi:hypothetical protein